MSLSTECDVNKLSTCQMVILMSPLKPVKEECFHACHFHHCAFNFLRKESLISSATIPTRNLVDIQPIPQGIESRMAGKGPHCSFVLLAEFDIDSGAQLTYQFPQPLGTDEG